MTALSLLHYRLRDTVYRLGRAGGIGLSLMVAALVSYLSALLPLQQSIHGQEQQRAVIEQSVKEGGARPGTRRLEGIDEFLAFFPPVDSAPRWLQTIYVLAEREHIELSKAAYKLSEDATLGLAHYRITMPMRAGYPQVRRFLASVLEQIPAAALDSVTFQRERVSDRAVEATVVLTLHLRAANQFSPDSAPQPANASARTLAQGDPL